MSEKSVEKSSFTKCGRTLSNVVRGSEKDSQKRMRKILREGERRKEMDDV